MKKMTIHLSDDLEQRVKEVALQERRSEADVIRDAIATGLARRTPAPRVPLPGVRLGDSSIAERAANLLDGFGQ
jgi:hypothetical protein